jgi:hypothetical protein
MAGAAGPGCAPCFRRYAGGDGLRAQAVKVRNYVADSIRPDLASQNSPFHGRGISFFDSPMYARVAPPTNGGWAMVALKTERRVFLWKLTPHSMPREAGKVVTLNEIVMILEAELAAGKARVYLSSSASILEDGSPEADEKHQLYIAQIKRNADSETVTILINRGDPNAVSPAFIDFTNSAVNIVQPKVGEAPGWSAHLVIAMKEDKGAYRACFEQMPRVSSSLVASAVEKIIIRAIQNSRRYTYETWILHRRNREKVMRPYRPVLGIQRIPSEKLQDDLAHGELTGVTITKRGEYYTGVGSKALVTKQEQKIVIHLKSAEPQTVADVVRGIVQKAKDDKYSAITFHIENLPGGATNSPTINLDDHDALEHLYVRAQRLTNFPIFLEACYSQICADIEFKMIDLINLADGW